MWQEVGVDRVVVVVLDLWVGGSGYCILYCSRFVKLTEVHHSATPLNFD